MMVILGMVLASSVAFGADPEISIVEGKVSIAADSAPLGLLLSLLDKATGLKSEVKAAGLANRRITMRVTRLELKDAVRKIFEGQSVNYLYIEGKGIWVIEASQQSAENAPATAAAPSSFQQSGPPTSFQPQAPTGAPEFSGALPLGSAPAANSSITGSFTAGTNNGPIPGQIPPPIGATNSFGASSSAAAPAIPAPTAMPSGPGPGSPGYKSPDEPPGPGNLGNVKPGVIGR